MSVIKIRNEQGEFVDIPVIKGERGLQGIPGEQGPQGEPGISVNVIKANNEEEAISLSQSNPNNIYYWEE